MREKAVFTGVAVMAVAVIAIFIVSSNGSGTAADVSAGAGSAAPAMTTVPFTTLVQGMQSGIVSRTNFIITSSSEMTKLWKMIGATSTPPTVDFNKDIVLAVFAGKTSSASIAVAKIEDTSERMVSITIAKPEGSCPQIYSTVSPYELVAVPATSLPVTHQDTLVPGTCPP